MGIVLACDNYLLLILMKRSFAVRSTCVQHRQTSEVPDQNGSPEYLGVAFRSEVSVPVLPVAWQGFEPSSLTAANKRL